MKLAKELLVFEKCVQKMNFAEAALSLNMTASAVGKIISRLEDNYKVNLFTRTTRGMSLTPEGEVFLKHCLSITAEMKALEDAFSGKLSEVSGNLKVSFPNLSLPFAEAISGFMSAYPQIRLEVILSDNHLDLVGEACDAVVRFGEIPNSRLIAKKIGCTRMHVVCSPSFNLDESDGAVNPVILYRFPSSGKIESWPAPYHKKFVANGFENAVIVNSIDLTRELCLKSCGIACLPDILVNDLIAQGQLISLYGDPEHSRDVSILWPQNKNMQPRLRAFVDYFSAYFRQSQ